MSNPKGLAISRQLIFHEAKVKTGLLDLGNLGLTRLPEEVLQLDHLHYLNLGNWYIEKNGAIRRSRNQLSTNRWSADFLPSAGLEWLKAISVSEVRITDLATLGDLVGIELIDIGYTPVADLSPLVNMRRLEFLCCTRTEISDLSALCALTNLQIVDCSHSIVTDLSPLAALTGLQELNCSKTQVSDLYPLASLTRLRLLDCSETNVVDLSPLANLTGLQELHCNGTGVSDLSQLAGLNPLRLLSANNCSLDSFPRGLLRDPPVDLRLYRTKIPGIPPEVLSQNQSDDCHKRLSDHLEDLKADTEPDTDVKTLVLGNGRIGKTQICRRLRGDLYDEEQSSTHGIVVTQTTLPVHSNIPATLKLWDFGGQDLYHGTHALFLRSRAVFLLVWTPQTENDFEYEYGGMRFRNQPLAYWLDYIRTSASPGCPVVLIQNQCDTAADDVSQIPVDSKQLLPFYCQFVHYSAKEDRNRGALNDSLAAAIDRLRGKEGLVVIGKGRVRVCRKLQEWLAQDAKRKPEHRQHRTLTRRKFRQLCDEGNDVSSAESLLEYLHNAGVVFCQRGMFRDEIILDQSWALDAIYTVFNREQCYRQLIASRGRFTRSWLELLVWGQYSQSEQELFLSLMESCGICFKTRDGDIRRKIEAEYAAPDLLPDRAGVSDQLAGRWDDGSAAISRCAWKFEFLHAGVIRSIVSAIGQKAGPTAVYWKYGVWFYDEDTRSQAVIHQEMEDDHRGRIVLRTQGDQRLELRVSVSKWLAGRIAQYSVSSVTYESDSTDGRSVDRPEPEVSRLPTIRIGNPPNDRPRRCISYAGKDEHCSDPTRAGKVDQFYKRLTAAGHEVYYDREQLELNDRLLQFMSNLGHGGLIYVFLSDAYLKSANCMYELLIIWQTCGDDREKFRKRTRVYVSDGTQFRTVPARLKYSAYWRQQLNEIRDLVDQIGIDHLSEMDLREFKRIRDFAHQVSEILSQFADVLQASSFDDFLDQALDELTPDENDDLVTGNGPRMNGAIVKARSTVDEFIAVLKSPKSSQSMFSIKMPFTQGDDTEHMWLTSVSYDGSSLQGAINNEPEKVKTVKMGQKVSVAPAEIIDWMYVESGKLIGGYTLRELRDTLKPAERAEFDKSLPFAIE